MAIETGLEGKPWYYAAGVAVLLAGAIYFAVHYFWIKDMKLQLERKEVQLTNLQQKIAEGRAAQNRLPQFEEEVSRLQLELDKLEKILPARRNTEDLLRRIRTLTEDGNFDLQSFAPQTPQTHEYFIEYPIQIVLEGTYHNLALLFDRMGRFSRIINIEQLTINALRSRDRPHHTIRASFLAKTFLKNEAESL